MAPTIIGILSDTHLSALTPEYKSCLEKSFKDAAIIFHAGDLTHINVLEAFDGKEVHAVHGNMCSMSSRTAFPAKKSVKIGSHTIAITHGYHYPIKNSRYIEDQLILDFPEADCIIYGHTHVPVCHTVGPVMIINPGSFMGTGPYGAPGTYAILEAGEGLQAKIHQVGRPDRIQATSL